MPFRAAATPSERSEYAQPDVALVLTTLAYYDDGLSPVEFTQVMQDLLSMGNCAQGSWYSKWLALSTPNIPPGAHALSAMVPNPLSFLTNIIRLIRTCIIEFSQQRLRTPSRMSDVVHTNVLAYASFMAAVRTSPSTALAQYLVPLYDIKTKRASAGSLESS